MAKNYFKYYCWLAVLVIIIYWPVSSFIFAMKNDALAGYFPAKYFISESIHNHVIPWWNPYINYGYPMHADFTSSFWSPFTWIFSLLGGYNVYTVHLEYLLYCILAAWGMFRLCLFLKQYAKAAFIIGLCYACGGIFTGNAQHTNWISAAALLPFVFQAFFSVIQNPSFRKAVILSLYTALFVVCAHPYAIVCFLYSAFFLLFFFSKKSPAPLTSILMQLNIALLLTLLLTSAYLISIVELFPYLTRSETLSASQLSNHFPPAALSSLLLPFTTINTDPIFGNTDLSMRNAYTGLVPLIFLLTVIAGRKNYYQKIFLTAAGIYLILSFGGAVTFFFNRFIPLAGFIRLISVFRLPAILFILLAAGYSLSDFIEGKENPLLKKIIAGLTAITVLLLCYAIISLLLNNQMVLPAGFNKAALKEWVNTITLQKTILIQAAIQIGLLLFMLKNKLQFHFKTIAALCFFDLLLATSLNAPFTIVGQQSVKEAQQLLKASHEDFPLPVLKPIAQNTVAGISFEKTFGNWSMYSKEPGTINKAKTYPSLFKTNEEYFKEGLNNIFVHSPFIYAARKITLYTNGINPSPGDSFTCFIDKKDWHQQIPGIFDSTTLVTLTNFSPNQIAIQASGNSNSFVVVKQNNYKNWKAYIDGNPAEIIPCNYTFMCIPVKQGSHKILFSYEPGIIKTLSAVNISVLILLLLYLLISYRTNNKF